VPTKKVEVRPTPAPIKKEPTPEKSYLLAIRLKGNFGTPWPIRKALETLRLRRKFNAVLLENSRPTVGMLRTVKDFVTWGEAKKTDIVALLRERGEFSGGAAMTDETIREKFGESSVQELASALTQGRISLRTLWQKGLNPVFRLHPPSGGFEGSIKRAYGSRGELGRRETALSSLLTQMV
jgi:large subunit ribosomal protein L30